MVDGFDSHIPVFCRKLNCKMYDSSEMMLLVSCEGLVLCAICLLTSHLMHISQNSIGILNTNIFIHKKYLKVVGLVIFPASVQLGCFDASIALQRGEEKGGHSVSTRDRNTNTHLLHMLDIMPFT